MGKGKDFETRRKSVELIFKIIFAFEILSLLLTLVLRSYTTIDLILDIAFIAITGVNIKLAHDGQYCNWYYRNYSWTI